ncbi:MAG: Gldg family protein [Thermodesulfobacteriota bacterium]
MKQILSISKKELGSYFGSPMAAIFVGIFLLASLFSFFWLETFFARNIADIRPLFRWMPLLMIFLAATLTMRQWSEEEKMGTLEVLLTLPVRLSSLVLGKFLAVLALIGLALLLTLGLPLSVSLMGDLDWGPVIGGYLGCLLMAASYISLGLFVSSRTDNQIIALLVSSLLGGFFYLLGSKGITGFFGCQAGDILRGLGTGSRFASIERGVIDLRDIVYYASLTIFFLSLNILSLDQKRWSKGQLTADYRKKAYLAVLLTGLNILALNLWLAKTSTARLDLTESQKYSLSPTSRDTIANLPEPLILKGYFSSRTHPLLAPLVPQIKDLMKEYRVAAPDRVELSFINPQVERAKEKIANQEYGIRPVPFQVASRYESGVVNSYFHILIKYGDQYEVLDFRDLISIDQRGGGELQVGLGNLEYELTKNIKKVVYGFKDLSAIFRDSAQPFRLILINTPSTLPASLQDIPVRLTEVVNDLRRLAGGKLKYREINPDSDGISREKINNKYGIQPLVTSLFSEKTFYFHLILARGESRERIFLGPDMSKAEIRKEIEGVLKKKGSGFLKTVGLAAPKEQQKSMMAGRRGMPGQNNNYQNLRQILTENYNVRDLDLEEGRVPSNVDVLLLAGPQNLGEKERFAIDQYLMRGGSVVILAGSYHLDIQPYSQDLLIKKVDTGLDKLLEHYGVDIEKTLVMDTRNQAFPVPVTRDLGGGIQVQEIKQIDYPFFVDIRSEGMASDHPAVSDMEAVTMNWCSPVNMDGNKTRNLKAEMLLSSSPNSWHHDSADIQPDFQQYPDNGFPGPPRAKEKQRETLAVTLQGSFSSYFEDRPDPRLTRRQEESDEKKDGEEIDQDLPPMIQVVNSSPESARLAVVGSSEFISDAVIGLSRSVGQDRYLNNIQFVQNLVDWLTAEPELLGIRSRASHTRVLRSMSPGEEKIWEWLNYGIALSALGVISFVAIRKRREEKPI